MSQSSPIKDRIVEKLQESFAPQRLEVIDESAKHAGHSGHDGRGESHFEVIIISAAFQEKSRVERHRMVYTALQTELAERVHALSIKAFTDTEAVDYKFRV